MRLFKGFVVAACASLLMACGGGSPLDKVMGHMDKVVAMVEANKGDLDKAAKEVQAYMDSNKATIEAETKAMMAWAEEKAKTFESDPEGAIKFAAEMEEKGAGLKARVEALEKEIPQLKEHEGLKKAMGGMASMMGGM